ncbi:MAG: quinoprotein dehydrogenase-associated SoxYZ-like carrier [Rhodospirillales bacterium]|nr:quinoprotein dehydrogenase-associated SoxYZ-like carrier [Rhodospirillales bacterium]MDH3910867.1 quinoprotein dehydrogenase-associated SoxYZ-like carrier [Rhodospirillales bacterium]MDH3918873.1 quinoprotein dehydrogenase-associated SoxYZ-like carrier [Rhodospirillales bacterium]MDH3970051.1 quinoprotein dehydrogenase-associated SoxYZ-like carrier [Rhodospirillales bacterium]
MTRFVVPHFTLRDLWLSAFVAGLALASGAAVAAAAEDDPWPDLKEALFEDRQIQAGDGVIRLEAPYRAYDAAIVPITLAAEIPQTPERYIRTITLIIDNNPAPVAAVFTMTPRSGTATISTRVRINAYTNVRAVAETNDGALYMASKFVKASGGCSAPASKDQDKALARLGKMKLKQSTPVRISRPNEAQLLISHPNYSGLQMDQVTRHYIPAYFVQDVTISYGDETIMTVEGAISLSEDPSFHFSFVPEGPGALTVEVRDTEDAAFTQSWPVEPEAGS